KRLARLQRRLSYFARQQLLALIIFMLLGAALASVTQWERLMGGPREWFLYQDDLVASKSLMAFLFSGLAAFYSWRGFFRKNNSGAACKQVAVTSLALAMISLLDVQLKASSALAGGS